MQRAPDMETCHMKRQPSKETKNAKMERSILYCVCKQRHAQHLQRSKATLRTHFNVRETRARARRHDELYLRFFFFLKTCGLHMPHATLKCACCIGCVSRVSVERYCCDLSSALRVFRFRVFCFLRGPPKHVELGVAALRARSRNKQNEETTNKWARNIGCGNLTGTEPQQTTRKSKK